MNTQSIISLKGSLPPWPQEGEAASLFEHSTLSHYADLYGFAQLDGLYQQYCFGAIESVAANSEMYDVACHRWRVAEPRAEFIVVHGLFDHVGLYVPLVKYLLAQQFNVLAFDLPEHGLSSGEHGGIDDFAIYAQSLADVLNVVDRSMSCVDLQRVALGQSTGGAVIMRYLMECNKAGRVSPIDKCVFIAPLLRVRGWRRIRISYRCLSWCLKRVPRSFTKNSHDSDFEHFLENIDPLQPRYISTRWVRAMLHWAAQFEQLENQDLPGIYIQGTQDETVDPSYNVPKILAKFSRLNLHEIDGALHHLIREAEPWRSKVYEAIVSVVNTD